MLRTICRVVSLAAAVAICAAAQSQMLLQQGQRYGFGLDTLPLVGPDTE